MLLYVLIVFICQIAAARGFLDNCPVDKEQRIGDTKIIDILQTFYNDLRFVQACTDTQHKRQYDGLHREMKDICSKIYFRFSITETYTNVEDLLKLIENDQVDQANNLIISNDYDSSMRGVISTYYHFIKAEVKRLSKGPDEASQAVLSAFKDRQKYKGISMNRLERLDGLLVLHKVSRFNKFIDKLFGIHEGPHYQKLRTVFSASKDDLRSFQDIRNEKTAEETSKSINDTSSDEALLKALDSLNPAGDLLSDDTDPNLSGQSVSEASVESILCEFAQKLNIIIEGDIKWNLTAPDYSGVIKQLRQLDESAAMQLKKKVVRYTNTDIRRARRSVRRMVRVYYSYPTLEDHARLSNPAREVYLAYLDIELNFIQSEDTCTNIHKFAVVQEIMQDLLYNRGWNEGLSLGKVAELQAKVALRWLECFHMRVKLAFELDGGEDEQQLEAKRSQVGDSYERILPDYILMQSNPEVE